MCGREKKAWVVTIINKLVDSPARISIHAEVIDNEKFLIETLRPVNTVYIFGAGHVAQRVAPLSESVGFRTVVLDDHGDFAC